MARTHTVDFSNSHLDEKFYMDLDGEAVEITHFRWGHMARIRECAAGFMVDAYKINSFEQAQILVVHVPGKGRREIGCSFRWHRQSMQLHSVVLMGSERPVIQWDKEGNLINEHPRTIQWRKMFPNRQAA